jgi:penicillin-binding protein 1B
MALKIRLKWPTGKHAWTSLLVRGALIAVALIVVTFFVGCSHYYNKYARIVDNRLKQPLFANTAKIFAAAREVRPGQKLNAHLIANELREAGYRAEGGSQSSQMGTFQEGEQSITVRPGPQSYHSQDAATIHINDGVVSSITDDRGQALSSYELEPLLITGLSEDVNRTKRRLISYDEIPPNLVQAVLAIEDRRFFEHGGVNYWRLMQAGIRDVTTGQKAQGGSTLTMQLARGFFLTPEKRFKRKIVEILITFQLEHRFTKKQLFEMYANQINLGQRGSFSIDGFGEASQAYFGKDVHQLDLAECATLAGIVQRPNYFNPWRHPDRTIDRRNLVLDGMVETGAITKDQAERAKKLPLHLSTQSVDASEAPYFVDLVRDQLNQKLGESEFNREGLRIYTSLDVDLQKAAAEAVEVGMRNVDELVEKLHARRRSTKAGEPVKPAPPILYPQVALVALNPHTGQVLALIGGRNYGNSQLNHAVAKRPTGSIFKPFVYAAAYNSTVAGTTLQGQDKPFTAVTLLNDEQTTYETAGLPDYTPRNYKDEYHGQVTAIYALAHSLNNATIGLAAEVGFDNVAALAREAGVKNARGTPSVAIGAYDATPLDMAGAYTIFANGGLHLDPWLMDSVRTPSGDVITDFTPTSKQVLDPRVAYLTTNLMEGVMNFGYGYEVRRRGFMEPAAGKTGTSHDVWFAGYTSNLLCIVWVGNDDYTDVKLAGATAAAPIWAEFMKRAVKLPQYSDTHAFTPPDGIELLKIDKVSNLLSDDACPVGYMAAFMMGTAPTETCDHPADHRNILQKIFGLGKSGN